MMGRSELLAKLEQEAAAWDSGSGDIAALLREAKAEIEHLAEASQGHFRQAMLNGQAANELRADAERWRYVQHGFSAMSLNIDGMHYWTWRGSSLLGRGPSIAAAVDAGMAEAPAVGAA